MLKLVPPERDTELECQSTFLVLGPPSSYPPELLAELKAFRSGWVQTEQSLYISLNTVWGLSPDPAGGLPVENETLITLAPTLDKLAENNLPFLAFALADWEGSQDIPEVSLFVPGMQKPENSDIDVFKLGDCWDNFRRSLLSLTRGKPEAANQLADVLLEQLGLAPSNPKILTL